MRIKVLGDNNYTGNIQEEFLRIRGVKDIKAFLDLEHVKETHYSEFYNMDLAIKCISKHINDNSNIGIIADCDVDGYTSASVIYSYLKTYFDNEVKLHMHHKKVHGIMMDDLNESGFLNDIKVLIVPDAGSQDYKQHKELKKLGIDVISLDHHQCPKYSKDAIVVNNQLSKKALNFTGATMAYKFLQALDDEYGEEGADDFLDLVAIGMIGDMADSKDIEVQYLVRKGISNVQNPLVNSILEANSFSIKGKMNQIVMTFNVVPLFNAIARMGTFEEKLLTIEALCNIDSDRIFDYEPSRGKNKGEVIKEDLYQHATRIIKSVKGRQDRSVEKSLEGSKRPPKAGLYEVIDQIEDRVLVVDVTDFIEDSGVSGLVANKITHKYNKPAIVMTNKGDGYYSGSGRGNQIDNFREKLSVSGLGITAEGHENAFGVRFTLKEYETLNDYVNMINGLFVDEKLESSHIVDFSIEQCYMEDYILQDLLQLEDYFGGGIKEPLIHVSNLVIETSDINVNAEKGMFSFTYNDIEYIMFKLSPEKLEQIVDWNETMCYNVVGSPKINEFDGRRIVQLIIKDIEVISNSSDGDTTKDEWGVNNGETDDIEW